MTPSMRPESIEKAILDAEKTHEKNLHELYRMRSHLDKQLNQLKKQLERLPFEADKGLSKLIKKHNIEIAKSEKKRRQATLKARHQTLKTGYDHCLDVLQDAVTPARQDPSIRDLVEKTYAQEVQRTLKQLSDQGRDAETRRRAAEKFIDGPFVVFAYVCKHEAQLTLPQHFDLLTQRLREDLLKNYGDLCVQHDKERARANWIAAHALALDRQTHEIEQYDQAIALHKQINQVQKDILEKDLHIDHAHQYQKVLAPKVELERTRDDILANHDHTLTDMQKALKAKVIERENVDKLLDKQLHEKEKNAEKRVRSELNVQANQIQQLQHQYDAQINEINDHFDGSANIYRSKIRALDTTLKQQLTGIKTSFRAIEKTLSDAERALTQAQGPVEPIIHIASDRFQETVYTAFTQWTQQRITTLFEALNRRHQEVAESLPEKKRSAATKKHDAECRKQAKSIEQEARALWAPIDEHFQRTRKKLKSLKSSSYAKVKAQIKPLHDILFKVLSSWSRQCSRAMKDAYEPLYQAYEIQLKTVTETHTETRKKEKIRLQALMDAHQKGLEDIEEQLQQALEAVHHEHEQFAKSTLDQLDADITDLEQHLENALIKVKPLIEPYAHQLAELELAYNKEAEVVTRRLDALIEAIDQETTQPITALTNQKKSADEMLAKTAKSMQEALLTIDKDAEQALEKNRHRHTKAMRFLKN